MMRDEAGSSLLESFLLGILLLVPLVWALSVLADLQRAALATSAAAREAGFEAARANDPLSADAAVRSAAHQALTDHGFDLEEAEVAWSGPPGFPRGGTVEVVVRVPVEVLEAPLIGRVADSHVWVRSTHIARIQPFGSRP